MLRQEKKIRKNRTVPIPINPRKNAWDKKVIQLAKKGLYYKTIAEVTGLTVGQVSGRIQKSGISPILYRKGESPEAIRVIERTNLAIRKLHGLNQSLNAMRRSIANELNRKW